MEPHSHFTFVETGIPSSRRGTSKGSTARSLIRSHAMQQVWEQRRLQRAHGHGDSNFEIVFENEKLEGTKKVKARACRHPSDTRPTSGKVKVLKKVTDRKLSSSDTSTEAALSFGAKGRRMDGRPEAWQGTEDETLLDPSIFSFPSLPFNRGANRYGGSPHMLWNSSPCASPHPIGIPLMDPFNTCAVSLGPKESRYMNHYFQALSWRFTMPKKTWLRYAIHDPGLLHGVLAIAAAHYSFATNRELSDDALFHHGKTINHVQKCLKDPQLRFSDGVIGAIGRMVVCHLIYGNRPHFITHTKALQRCAEARGGLESLGMVGQLKYIIASCVAGAATIWWEDVPPQLKYPYGPLDYPAVDDVPDAEAHDSEWGSAFRELHKIGFLSDALLDICEALVSLNSVISSRRSWDEPQQRIFGDQCNKLSLRLVYLKEQEAISHPQMTSWDHMRFCTHLTVHFYITAFQREVPLLANVSIQTLHELRKSLSFTDLENSWGGGQFGELLLWITIITAAGCFGPQERECAGAQLRRCALMLGITDWLEVKRICTRFLFLDSAVEWRTWPLWKDYGPRSEDDLSLISSEASLPSTD
jgi:Fungal specific transcription factor domain